MRDLPQNSSRSILDPFSQNDDAFSLAREKVELDGVKKVNIFITFIDDCLY